MTTQRPGSITITKYESGAAQPQSVKPAIAYKFARDADGTCRDIEHVSPTDRGQFTCYGCTRPLVPHLGNKKAWHFQHKAADAICGRETYLHRLAKAAFVEAYAERLHRRQPFYLDIPVPSTCTHYQQKLGFVCERVQVQQHDLTTLFDSIAVEAPVDGFVADVLLTSSNSGERLLIEFAVTHQCEQAKVDSGLRIVEAAIRDESSIERMRQGHLVTGDGVYGYNLNPRPATMPICGGECHSRVLLFIVYSSGKAWSKVMTPRDALKYRARRSALHQQIIPHVIDPEGCFIDQLAPYPDEPDLSDPAAAFRKASTDAYFKQIPIKSCYVCRYHGINGQSAAVFCKRHRRDCSANEAADCAQYSPTKTRGELKQIQRQNRRWMRQHGFGLVLSRMLRPITMK